MSETKRIEASELSQVDWSKNSISLGAMLPDRSQEQWMALSVDELRTLRMMLLAAPPQMHHLHLLREWCEAVLAWHARRGS